MTAVQTSKLVLLCAPICRTTHARDGKVFVYVVFVLITGVLAAVMYGKLFLYVVFVLITGVLAAA